MAREENWFLCFSMSRKPGILEKVRTKKEKIIEIGNQLKIQRSLALPRRAEILSLAGNTIRIIR